MEKLSEKCSICSSWTWCGRSCARAPVPVRAEPPKPPAKQARPKQAPPVSEPEPHRCKDGKGYSRATALCAHNCEWCGAEFTGSRDKVYCSTACRVASWRDKRRGGEGGHIGKQLLIGWSQRRFAVLERDGFKCRYCGKGAKQNAVLHVDHVHPRAAGGTDDLDNLVAACQECNRGKGSHLIHNKPE